MTLHAIPPFKWADLDGDGQAELLGRCTSGIEPYSFDTTTGV